jgi:hypothetical protein
MAAATMRDRWTDERLDDLNAKVDDGFRRMDERFTGIDGRLDGMQRTMTQGFIAMFGVQVTLFLGILAFIAVH